MTAQTAALPAQLVGDLAEFEDWLVGANCSAQTVQVRVKAVRTFVREWGTWDVRPAVVATTLRRWDGWTARTYFNHMRSVFAWAVETGRVATDPTARMKAPPQPRPAPRPLDVPTLNRAIDAAPARARAYLLLAFLAGLRAHEIAKLRGEDITETTLRVVGKGGKAAVVPTHPALWALAQQYPRRGLWFPSPSTSGPVRPNSVGEAVRLVMRGIGVETGSIHQVRASYGTELLRAGTNIRVVQDLMRHGSLASTEHYLGVDEGERRHAIAALHLVPGHEHRRPLIADSPAVVPDVVATAGEARALAAQLLDRAHQLEASTVDHLRLTHAVSA